MELAAHRGGRRLVEEGEALCDLAGRDEDGAFEDESHRLELPVPEPGPGEVRVRVRTASLNGFDLSVASGMLQGMMEAARCSSPPGRLG